MLVELSTFNGIEEVTANLTCSVGALVVCVLSNNC